MKPLPLEERRWFFAAVVLVLVGSAILLLPFETIPVLGDSSFAESIIVAMGLGIILRILVLLRRARRQLRRRSGPRQGFDIRIVGKEAIQYREGLEAHTFVAAWGGGSRVLYVPAEPDWLRVMPLAFRDRRDEIVGRLRSYSGHVVEDDMTEL